MSWNTRIDLHLDVNAPYGRALLTSATDSSLLNAPPDVVEGDQLTVRLHFWSRGSTPGSLVVADPGDTATLRFSARAAGVPADSELLFLVDDFTEISEGVWEGELDLHTAELAAHLAESPAGAKGVTGEVEVTVGARVRSLQFPLTARPQVYDAQPAPSPLPSSLEWLAENGVRYLRGVTGLTGGGATKLDGQASADFTVGSMVMVAQYGVTYLYQLYAIADPEDSPRIIRCDDAAGVKAWALVEMGVFRLEASEYLLAGSIGTPGFLGVRNTTGNAGLVYSGLLTNDRDLELPDMAGTLMVQPPVATESTTARTLALADSGTYLRLTNASACTLTVPPNATVAFPLNTEIHFRIAAAGIPTITEGSGVTVNNKTALAGLSTHKNFTLKKIATDTWDLIA